MIRCISIFALILSMVCSPASASPVLQGAITNPTGVTGLLVEGIEYDATFSTKSFSDTFGLNPPTFRGNQSSAISASIALAAVLNRFGVNTIGNVICSGNQLGTGCLYLFPWFIDGALVQAEDTSIYQNYPSATDWVGGIWSTQVSGIDSPLGEIGGGYLAFVKLVPTNHTVPEPSSLFLLCLGSGGIFLAWRVNSGSRSFKRTGVFG